MGGHCEECGRVRITLSWCPECMKLLCKDCWDNANGVVCLNCDTADYEHYISGWHRGRG